MTDDPDEPPRSGPMIALLVIIVLIIGGLWLTKQLSAVSKMQDCLMSGRTNCAPVGGGK
jgi:hypothetical protein